MVLSVNCGWCEKEFPTTEQGQKDADEHATNCPQRVIETQAWIKDHPFEFEHYNKLDRKANRS